jgi:hypothetical protein
MKALTKFAAVAALALSATAIAGAASATTFIDVAIGTSGDPESHSQFTWTDNGGGLGTLSSVAGATATLYFDDPAFAAYSGLLDTFTLSATSTVASGGALDNNGTTLTEKGLDGDFAFMNGTTLLLGGHVTGGWLQGAIGANSANFNNSSGVVTFTSDIPGLLNGLVNESFGFSLTGIPCAKGPPMVGCVHVDGAGTTTAGFTARSASGSFDGQLAVPEPATWGLMLVGFGGMGALLRNRRRTAAVAA